MATPTALTTALLAAGLPAPSPTWLQTNLFTSSRTIPPLPALVAATRMKLLPLDLTSPGLFAPSAVSFPPNLSDPTIKEIRLAEPVLGQVLDVQDIGRSRWEQIEALEAVERGERMVGREIIRDVPAEDGEDGTPAAAPGQRGQGQNQRDKKAGPHKLVLQDWKGQTVFALELEAVDKVGVGMCIGAKILLKAGTVVARGMMLLEPRSANVLGGKIEGLHELWVRDKKMMLAEGIEAAQEEGGNGQLGRRSL